MNRVKKKTKQKTVHKCQLQRDHILFSLMFQVKTSAHLLKFTAEMAVRLSSFHSWRTDLPHQHPWRSSTFLSHWVLSKTNAAQPMELYPAECKSEAVLAAHRWCRHKSAQLKGCQQRRWPRVFSSVRRVKTH